VLTQARTVWHKTTAKRNGTFAEGLRSSLCGGNEIGDHRRAEERNIKNSDLKGDAPNAQGENFSFFKKQKT